MNNAAQCCKAVVLDMDGTLVDSNDQHAQAWCDTLAEFDRPAPFIKVRRLIGMGGDKVLPKTTGLTEEDPLGKQIVERRKQIFRERYLDTIRAFPQSREMLERMRSAGLKLVLATSSEKEMVDPLLREVGATDLIDEITSSSDAENSKPDPDIVLAAIAKLDVPRPQIVMLGDTPYDIAAATKAGIRTIALRCGGWNDADLAGALAIFDSPADLLAKFEQSPLARPPRE